MSLRTFLGGTDDAVTIYRRDLMTAVKNGDTTTLQTLLKNNIDAPPEALNDPLTRAVSKNQVRLAELLLDAPGTRAIDNSTLRATVYNSNTDMFRLLTDRGFDFASAVPSEQANDYLVKLRFMRKDYECDLLRKQLVETKRELTTLRKAAGLPEPEDKPLPRSFTL